MYLPGPLLLGKEPQSPLNRGLVGPRASLDAGRSVAFAGYLPHNLDSRLIELYLPNTVRVIK